jgi:hypothetical protein
MLLLFFIACQLFHLLLFLSTTLLIISIAPVHTTATTTCNLLIFYLEAYTRKPFLVLLDHVGYLAEQVRLYH